MNKQPDDNTKQKSQTKLWSDAELRRVARVFELLIRVDKRLNEGKNNELQNNASETSK